MARARQWLDGAAATVAALGCQALRAPLVGAAFYARHPRAGLREVLNGVTVACMQVPESIAFSYIGLIDPLAGLYATFFIGLFVAVTGGKPGMIGGLAGALMVVSGPQLMADTGLLGSLPVQERWQHYLLTMVLVGVLQLVIGAAGLTAALRLVPRPTHVGFLNGLAVVILITQVHEFQVCDAPGAFITCPAAARSAMSLRVGATWAFLGMVGATAAIAMLFPRVPRVGKLLPSSLVAIIVCTVFEHAVYRRLAGSGTRTVGDTAPISGRLPGFALPHPPPGGEWHFGAVAQVAAMLTLIGTSESLLSLRALDAASSVGAAPSPQVVERKMRQECLAEGAGNLIGALFGSVGGGIMIGTSTVNLMSGSRGRLSGTVAALTVLAVLLFAAPAVALIPAATLVGLMLVVAVRTADWGSVRALLRMPRADALQLVVVSVVCVVANIAVGVAVGVLMAALVHVARDSRTLSVTTDLEAEDAHDSDTGPERDVAGASPSPLPLSETAPTRTPGAATAPLPRRHGVRHLHVHGRLSFTTTWAFEYAMAAGLPSAPSSVVVDFTAAAAAAGSGAVLADYSALRAVYAAVKTHAAAGVSLRLRGVDASSAAMLMRAGTVQGKGRGILRLALAPLEASALDPPEGTAGTAIAAAAAAAAAADPPDAGDTIPPGAAGGLDSDAGALDPAGTAAGLPAPSPVDVEFDVVQAGGGSDRPDERRAGTGTRQGGSSVPVAITFLSLRQAAAE